MGMNLIFTLLMIVIAIILLFVLIELFAIPIMALTNRISDKKGTKDAQIQYVGHLTVGIKDTSSTGEVAVIGDNFGKSVRPAKIFDGYKDVTSIPKGEKVLIIHIHEGVAYVVPRGYDPFENL